jgi:hypothetical protein
MLRQATHTFQKRWVFFGLISPRVLVTCLIDAEDSLLLLRSTCISEGDALVQYRRRIRSHCEGGLHKFLMVWGHSHCEALSRLVPDAVSRNHHQEEVSVVVRIALKMWWILRLPALWKEAVRLRLLESFFREGQRSLGHSGWFFRVFPSKSGGPEHRSFTSIVLTEECLDFDTVLSTAERM